MSSLSLRPGDSLTIQKMALSIGVRSFGFPPVCNPSYGALTFTPVGLTPTEHASLCWTHSVPITSSPLRHKDLRQDPHGRRLG